MTRTLPLVKKEIRAVAPVTAMCLAVFAVTFLLGADWQNLGLLAYVVGSAGVGATVIGHEFSSATLGTLLVQPVARERIMAIKLLVAALALAVIGATASRFGQLDRAVPGELLSVLAFQGLVFTTALFVAPWLTMLARSAMAGTVGSLTSPIALAIVLSLLGFFNDEDPLRFRVLAAAMAVLSVTAAVWGWWLFTRRLEDLGLSTEQIQLRFGQRQRIVGRAGRHRRAFGTLRELVGKEIRLQELPLVIAGIYLTTSLLAWLTTGVVPADLDPRQAHFAWLYGGATALLIGAVTSAEERQLGTMPWQIILPVPAWQQFMVKSLLAVALSVALTWGLPGVMALTVAEPSSVFVGSFWTPQYGLATLGLTMVGLYVSSLTGTSLRAFFAALPVIGGLAGVFFVARFGSFFLGLHVYDAGYSLFGNWLAWAGEFSRREFEPVLLAALGVLAVGLVVLAWRFALANHSRADGGGRLVRRQALAVGAYVLIGSLSVFSLEEAVVTGPTNRGAIRGVVVDEHGEPVANVAVIAEEIRYLTGRRRLLGGDRLGVTDDRGRFLIGRLAPGNYYPIALTGVFAENMGVSPTSGFAPTFYPSTSDSGSALAVAVDGRTEVGDLTIRLIRAPMARLAGRLTDEGGRPVTDGPMFLQQTESDEGATHVVGIGKAGPDGRFSFDNVPPGTYTVQARGPRVGGLDNLFGWRIVTIDGDDVTDVDITTTAGGVLRGTVVLDGDSAPPLPNEVRVSTQATRLTLAGSSAGRVQDDWTFEVTRLFGLNVVRATSVSSAWLLKAVSLDGRDVTDTPIEFRSADEIDGLEVVLTDRVAHILGSVHNQAGKPAGRRDIVVFSTDSATWTFPSRYVHRVRSRPDGSFEMLPLLPGDYLVVALTLSAARNWENPELLEALRPLATPVTLGVGDTVKVSLVIAR